VTCYFRHLGYVFQQAEITVTPQNKKQLDAVIHRLVGTNYKDCSATWREVKKQLAVDEAGFVLKLKEAWKNEQTPLTIS
jgi:hypothetical protein